MLRQGTIGPVFRLAWQIMQKRHCCHSIASVEVRRRVTQEEVDKFAAISGDNNFVHTLQCPSEQRCIHGALLNGLVSGVIGTKLPGPGSIVVAQKFSFPNKCVVDEEITITVKLIENRKIKKVQYECKQCGNTVFIGSADLIVRKIAIR